MLLTLLTLSISSDKMWTIQSTTLETSSTWLLEKSIIIYNFRWQLKSLWKHPCDRLLPLETSITSLLSTVLTLSTETYTTSHIHYINTYEYATTNVSRNILLVINLQKGFPAEILNKTQRLLDIMNYLYSPFGISSEIFYISPMQACKYNF